MGDRDARGGAANRIAAASASKHSTPPANRCSIGCMTKPILPGEVAAAVVDPVAYGQWDSLHEQLTWARANAPLAVAENHDHDPFWLVTRHADIMAISRDPLRSRQWRQQSVERRASL